MLRTRLFVAAFLIIFTALAGGASEPRISATMVASAVSVKNGVADATFRIEIKNDDSVELSDTFVLFSDDMELAVGVVPAEGTASSEEMTRSFDVGDNPSKYTPIPVTLKYSVDGTAVETKISVVLTVEQ